MKNICWILIWSILLISCKGDGLKKIDEESLITAIVEEALPSPENLIFRNERGRSVSYEEYREIQEQGNFFEEYYVDKEGKIVEIVIREKQPKDEALLAKINRALNAKGDIKTIPDMAIDCNERASILQKAFEQDQNPRRSGQEIDSEIEKENLITIINFVEKCGIPTLGEVNFEQMAGIWLVLQHAPPFYQKKYIPLIEEAAKKGDLSMAVVATMKDRALMNEGKPQVYGTQVKDGQLYLLEDPEYVDQRRADMEMGSLEEYLENFSLEFDVPQKSR